MPSPYSIIQTRAVLHVETLGLINELAAKTGVEVSPLPPMPGWMDSETKANEERKWVNANLRAAIDALPDKEGTDHGSEIPDGE